MDCLTTRGLAQGQILSCRSLSCGPCRLIPGLDPQGILRSAGACVHTLQPCHRLAVTFRVIVPTRVQRPHGPTASTAARHRCRPSGTSPSQVRPPSVGRLFFSGHVHVTPSNEPWSCCRCWRSHRVETVPRVSRDGPKASGEPAPRHQRPIAAHIRTGSGRHPSDHLRPWALPPRYQASPNACRRTCRPRAGTAHRG